MVRDDRTKDGEVIDMKHPVRDARQRTRGCDPDAHPSTLNRECNSPDRGQMAYEADVAKYPTYHDGRPRKKWSQLSKLAKSRW